MRKINGQEQVAALGNTAPDGLRWGEFLQVGKACDRFLRERGIIYRRAYRSRRPVAPIDPEEEME